MPDFHLLAIFDTIDVDPVDHELLSGRRNVHECASMGSAHRSTSEGKRVVVPLLNLAIERHRHTIFARRVLELLNEPLPVELPENPAEVAAITIYGSGGLLTAREVEVLRLLASGASNNVIAEHLVISPHTAKRHVAHVYAKLNVSSRAEATLRARDLGLI